MQAKFEKKISQALFYEIKANSTNKSELGLGWAWQVTNLT